MKRLTDRAAQIDGGIVVTLLNRVDGLTGDTDQIGELLLRQVKRGAGRFQFEILHSASPPFRSVFGRARVDSVFDDDLNTDKQEKNCTQEIDKRC